MKEFQDEINEYRRHLIELQQKMQHQYDTAVVALSGGALGLSMTFIKDVVVLNTATSKGYLLASWLCWAASICAVLISYFTSALAMQKAIKQTDQKSIYIEAAGGLLNAVTKLLNPLSGILFISGIVCMMTFIWRNQP